MAKALGCLLGLAVRWGPELVASTMFLFPGEIDSPVAGSTSDLKIIRCLPISPHHAEICSAHRMGVNPQRRVPEERGTSNGFMMDGWVGWG